jgi:hypothetical protein
MIMIQIAHYLGAVQIGEQQLAESFKMVGERHSREPEPREMCYEFSQWATGHVEGLKPYTEQHGAQENLSLEQLRASLFQGARVGALGMLHDYQDLSVLANALRTNYTILHQAAMTIKDVALEKMAEEFGEQVNREIEWLCTQIKIVSPQALTVPPNLPQETVASRPKYPTPAAIPDQVWAPLMGGILTLIVGLLSLLAGMVWLFPSLGPTIYLQTQKPAEPASRFLNVVLGHFLGLAAGFAGIFLFNAFNDPVTLQAKELTSGRLGAAVVALALTLLLTLLLKAHHPPAGATTLLTALGSIQTGQDALNLMIGVLIVAIAGELVRKTRTSTLTQMSVEPRVPAKDGKL